MAFIDLQSASVLGTEEKKQDDRLSFRGESHNISLRA
jgi:hypothetical protein